MNGHSYQKSSIVYKSKYAKKNHFLKVITIINTSSLVIHNVAISKTLKFLIGWYII
jgi:hypothetical protein